MTNPNNPARLIRWQRITIAVLLCGLALCGVMIKAQMHRAETAEQDAGRRMRVARAVSNMLWESNLRLEFDRGVDQLSLKEYRDHLNRYECRYGEIDPPQRDSDPWAYTSTEILPDPMTQQQAVIAAQRFVRAAATSRLPNRGTAPAVGLLPLGITATVPDQANVDPNRWLVVGTAALNGVPLRWRVVEHRNSANHWDAESVRIGLR